MSVCACAFVCMCAYLCVCICPKCTYIYVYMYIYVPVCAYMYSFIYICTTESSCSIAVHYLFLKKTHLFQSSWYLLTADYQTDQKGIESNTLITLQGNSCKPWPRHIGGSFTLCTAISHFVFVL